MEEPEVFERIVSIITPYCRNTESLKQASQKTHFLKDLNINSARFVDIILAIEDEFNIAIDDEAADGIETIGDIINLVSVKAEQI